MKQVQHNFSNWILFFGYCLRSNKERYRQSRQSTVVVKLDRKLIMQMCINEETETFTCQYRSKVGDPVAQSAAVEMVMSDDRSLIVHSHRRILSRKSVGCVIVGWERGAEYTESRV